MARTHVSSLRLQGDPNLQAIIRRYGIINLRIVTMPETMVPVLDMRFKGDLSATAPLPDSPNAQDVIDAIESIMRRSTSGSDVQVVPQAKPASYYHD